MAISNAVSTESASKVVGYELRKGNFQNETPNLPMRVAVFGQANTDKQTGLTNDPVEVISENEAGQLFGFGSQIHMLMRILRSRTSDLMGGIPTIVYPQLAPGAGVGQENTITVTGSPSASTEHILNVNGRGSFDGFSLAFPIVTTDTPTTIAIKIADKVNLATSCPVSAAAAAGVVTLTAKWIGLSTAEFGFEVDLQNKDVGMAYAVAQVAAGVGTSDTEINASLALFGNQWNTIVVNPYTQSSNALFEAFNGVPGAIPTTGRYKGEVFKPYVCLVGSLASDTIGNITTGLDKDQGTIVQCVAPNSKGIAAEAAANCAVLLARQAQDTPHLDISGMSYPDMPVPGDGLTGVFETYSGRDAVLKGGSSTVMLKNGKFEIQDFATTYHPDNENPPQFRYVRSLIQDWNVRYGYFLLEEVNVVDHAIIGNDQPSSVSGTIKPKQWIGILNGYFDSLTRRALIVEPEFSSESLIVGTSETNPDRFETSFPYKRSPYARISSTTVTAGFAFGLNS